MIYFGTDICYVFFVVVVVGGGSSYHKIKKTKHKYIHFIFFHL